MKSHHIHEGRVGKKGAVEGPGFPVRRSKDANSKLVVGSQGSSLIKKNQDLLGTHKGMLRPKKMFIVHRLSCGCVEIKVWTDTIFVRHGSHVCVADLLCLVVKLCRVNERYLHQTNTAVLTTFAIKPVTLCLTSTIICTIHLFINIILQLTLTANSAGRLKNIPHMQIR